MDKKYETSKQIESSIEIFLKIGINLIDEITKGQVTITKEDFDDNISSILILFNRNSIPQSIILDDFTEYLKPLLLEKDISKEN